MDVGKLTTIVAVVAATFVAGGCNLLLGLFHDEPLTEPQSLLIYYGIPESINGSASVAAAASHFTQYDYVVLGAGLELATHPNHASTTSLLARADMQPAVVFGYVDLGVSTSDFSLDQIRTRVDAWQSIGADGIFFDDFGYDFGTSRARQNQAVAYVHSVGMPVFANAFVAADAFGTEFDGTYNPTRTPTELGSSDFYLYESHQVILGALVDVADWLQKARQLQDFQTRLGFQVMSVTTPNAATGYDADAYAYAWTSALMFGHAATEWGEPDFAAASSAAPWRDPPVLTPGDRFTGPVWQQGTKVSRRTSAGTLWVNTTTGTSGLEVPL